jgi:hypothetical protein
VSEPGNDIADALENKPTEIQPPEEAQKPAGTSATDKGAKMIAGGTQEDYHQNYDTAFKLVPVDHIVEFAELPYPVSKALPNAIANSFTTDFASISHAIDSSGKTKIDEDRIQYRAGSPY